MEKRMIIAIDGPVGSGKGTLAVALAKKLNALYIYTGGMYRAVTLKCLEKNVDINNEEGILNLLKNTSISLGSTEYVTRVLLDNEDVSTDILSPEVSRATPIVAAHKNVRREIVKRQKELIEGQKAIIEGRDIASDVSPDANLKIYLTADLETRTRRRFIQLKKRGIHTAIGEVKKEIEDRDNKDMEREASPLTIAKDAVVIDTTEDTVEETVEKVMKELKERGLA